MKTRKLGLLVGAGVMVMGLVSGLSSRRAAADAPVWDSQEAIRMACATTGGGTGGTTGGTTAGAQAPRSSSALSAADEAQGLTVVVRSAPVTTAPTSGPALPPTCPANYQWVNGACVECPQNLPAHPH